MKVLLLGKAFEVKGNGVRDLSENVITRGACGHTPRLFQGFDHLPDLHAKALDSSHRNGAAGQVGYSLHQQGSGHSVIVCRICISRESR